MDEYRKLAAILVADVVGFSRLTGTDEDLTLARQREVRSDYSPDSRLDLAISDLGETRLKNIADRRRSPASIVKGKMPICGKR